MGYDYYTIMDFLGEYGDVFTMAKLKSIRNFSGQ